MVTGVLMMAAQAFAGGDNTLLPDGQEFEFWERPAKYSATYHVARETPGASDDNPGTVERPWKTIGKAAGALRPGERVIVHKGVYRESVHPERGGTGPDAMIAYEAARGEEVVIKGSDEWTPAWEPSVDLAINRIHDGKPVPPPAMPPIHAARLGGAMFSGANTFNLRYLPKRGSEETAVIGQIFQDGRRLRQATAFAHLKDADGAFFVEADGMTVHLRTFKDQPIASARFEIVTRTQLFAPLRQRLNYIRVSGFKMLHASPTFDPPLQGALSTSGGHHWIIEDNEVGFVTSRGIYFGTRWFEYAFNDQMGGHIVRRNHVHNVGLSGMSSVHFKPNEGMLVEDNLVTDVGEFCEVSRSAQVNEGAGIKLHYTVNSLVRRNVVTRMRGVPGIWLDWTITNSRVTQNLLTDIHGSAFGAVFVEISPLPCLVDNNIIIDTDMYGAYHHDTARLMVVNNLIANGGGPAVQLLMPGRGRTLPPPGKPAYHPEGDCRVYGNILSGYEQYMLLAMPSDRSDWNVLASPPPPTPSDGKAPTPTAPPFRIGERGGERDIDAKAWREMGRDLNSPSTPIRFSFDPKTMQLAARADAGVKLPTFPPLPAMFDSVPAVADALPGYFPFPTQFKIGATVAPMAELLRADFLGKPRDPAKLVPGALLQLPLDGKPVNVDPRRPRP